MRNKKINNIPEQNDIVTHDDISDNNDKTKIIKPSIKNNNKKKVTEDSQNKELEKKRKRRNRNLIISGVGLILIVSAILTLLFYGDPTAGARGRVSYGIINQLKHNRLHNQQLGSLDRHTYERIQEEEKQQKADQKANADEEKRMKQVYADAQNEQAQIDAQTKDTTGKRDDNITISKNNDGSISYSQDGKEIAKSSPSNFGFKDLGINDDSFMYPDKWAHKDRAKDNTDLMSHPQDYMSSDQYLSFQTFNHYIGGDHNARRDPNPVPDTSKYADVNDNNNNGDANTQQHGNQSNQSNGNN